MLPCTSCTLARLGNHCSCNHVWCLSCRRVHKGHRRVHQHRAGQQPQSPDQAWDRPNCWHFCCCYLQPGCWWISSPAISSNAESISRLILTPVGLVWMQALHLVIMFLLVLPPSWRKDPLRTCLLALCQRKANLPLKFLRWNAAGILGENLILPPAITKTVWNFLEVNLITASCCLLFFLSVMAYIRWRRLF